MPDNLPLMWMARQWAAQRDFWANNPDIPEQDRWDTLTKDEQDAAAGRFAGAVAGQFPHLKDTAGEFLKRYSAPPPAEVTHLREPDGSTVSQEQFFQRKVDEINAAAFPPPPGESFTKLTVGSVLSDPTTAAQWKAEWQNALQQRGVPEAGFTAEVARAYQHKTGNIGQNALSADELRSQTEQEWIDRKIHNRPEPSGGVVASFIGDAAPVMAPMALGALGNVPGEIAGISAAAAMQGAAGRIQSTKNAYMSILDQMDWDKDTTEIGRAHV